MKTLEMLSAVERIVPVPFLIGKNVAKMSLKNVAKKERVKYIINKIKSKEPFTLITLAKELNVKKRTIDRDIEELNPFFAIETCSCSIY